jgi:hypothetical protein
MTPKVTSSNNTGGGMVRIYEGIYEGTDQIRRMVIARKTFTGVPVTRSRVQADPATG